MAIIVKPPNAEKLKAIPPPVWEGKTVNCKGCECQFTIERGDNITPAAIGNREGFWTFCKGCGHPVFAVIKEHSNILVPAGMSGVGGLKH